MLDFSECTILVVDDTKTNIDILINGLACESYDIAVAVDGVSALEITENLQPNLILLDIMMPGMDGYEVCRALKNNHKTKNIPIIFLTALDQVSSKNKGFEYGCVDYIPKPFEISEVRARVRTHLELSLVHSMLEKQNIILEQKVKERTRDLVNSNNRLRQAQVEIVMRLGLATEMRDDCTGEHVQRIAQMVEYIAGKCKIPEKDCVLWGLASTMHDVGKVGIKDSVLLKPGKLTEQEFAEIRTHTEIGGKILDGSDSKLLQIAYLIALNHHEKWNGKGYPNGIAGEEIPLAARITAIADVFDALITVRPYKQAWPLEKIIALLEKEAGEHFDPEVTKIFIESIPELMVKRSAMQVGHLQ